MTLPVVNSVVVVVGSSAPVMSSPWLHSDSMVVTVAVEWKEPRSLLPESVCVVVSLLLPVIVSEVLIRLPTATSDEPPVP